MTKSTSSAMTAEAAIAESIHQLRDEILYYARLHLALESPLDIQTLANWARLNIADQEEQTLTALNMNGSFETGELECTQGVTYSLPAVPDAVISHIQVVSSRLSDITREAFLCLSMAHFRLWQADEDLMRSNFLHALQSFQSAVFNLSEGMSTLGIELGGHSSILSNIGKKTVSQRWEQKLKPGWQDHCRRVIAEGHTIERLSELQNIPGYDPALMKVTSATLRDWAKEAGIKFKSGRPRET